MHSFKTALATVALLMASISTAKDYYINPSTVLIADRQSWCVSQRAACPLLCMQNTGNGTSVISNECEPETLIYECLCSNGISPNMTEYSQTIPYFECVEFGRQCVASCGRADNICQSQCTEQNPCGAQNPTRYNITTTSSAVATATGGSGSQSTGGAVDGFAAEPTTTSGSSSPSGNGGSSGANMAMNLGQSWGLAVMFTGLFAGFALVM